MFDWTTQYRPTESEQRGLAKAHQSYIKWINDNWRRLGLKVGLERTLCDSIPGLCYASSSMIFRECQIEGGGFGRTETEAIGVSVAELIERSVLQSQGSGTSNGYAVHLSEKLAKRSAFLELLERDSLLCHHYSRLPFGSFYETAVPFGKAPSLHRLLEIQKFNDIRVHIGTLQVPSQAFGFVVAIDGEKYKKPFGVILGSSVDFDEWEALEKASREAIIYFLYLEASTAHLKTGEFRASDSAFLAMDAHASHALATGKAEWFRNMFGNHQIESNADDFLPQVHFERLEMPEEFGGIPLVGVKCWSRETQALFFGIASSQTINVERMKKFNPEFTFETISPIPHFLR